MNLGRQYQLIISGLLILVVGALSLSLSIWFRKSAETVAHSTDQAMRSAMVEQIETRGLAVASSVSRYLVNPVYQFDMEAIREILKTAEPNRMSCTPWSTTSTGSYSTTVRSTYPVLVMRRRRLWMSTPRRHKVFWCSG